MVRLFRRPRAPPRELRFKIHIAFAIALINHDLAATFFKSFDEEISQAYYDVLDGGATQAAMQDATKTRISGPLVKVLVKAGTTGSDYIVVCTIVTTEGRTLQQRALLQVRNVAD